MIFDIIIVSLVFIGLISGIFKGLVQEALGFISLLLSFLIARIFANDLSNYILKWFQWSEEIRYVIAWIAIFITVSIFTSLFSFLITKAIYAIKLGCLNRILGGAFGAAKFLFISSLLLNLYSLCNNYLPMPFKEDISKSKLYNITIDFAPIVYSKGKDVMDNNFNDSQELELSKKSNTKDI